MRLTALTVLSLGLVLFSCESHEVEQIAVQIPEGISVPEGKVYIPAGEFIMGDPDDPKTKGGVKIWLDAYLLDKYEVSRGSYKEFKPGYSVSPKKKKFPAAHTNFFAAESYCKWRGGAFAHGGGMGKSRTRSR